MANRAHLDLNLNTEVCDLGIDNASKDDPKCTRETKCLPTAINPKNCMHQGVLILFDQCTSVIVCSLVKLCEMSKGRPIIGLVNQSD